MHCLSLSPAVACVSCHHEKSLCSRVSDLAAALAASLAEEGVRPGGAPPASKHAVKALVKETLTETRLKQLGGPDAQCSVCRQVTHSTKHIFYMQIDRINF